MFIQISYNIRRRNKSFAVTTGYFYGYLLLFTFKAHCVL